jgi:hypothetical protein
MAENQNSPSCSTLRDNMDSGDPQSTFHIPQSTFHIPHASSFFIPHPSSLSFMVLLVRSTLSALLVERHKYLSTKDILVQEDKTDERKHELNYQNISNIFKCSFN